MNGFEGEGLNVNRRVRGRQRRPPTSQGNKDSAAKVRHQGREFFKTFTRSFWLAGCKIISTSQKLVFGVTYVTLWTKQITNLKGYVRHVRSKTLPVLSRWLNLKLKPRMLQKYLIRVRNYVFNILYNILFPDHSGSTSTSQSNPSQKLLSPSKSLYRHVADLWQTWLPPKAVDSLQKGKCLKTNSLG